MNHQRGLGVVSLLVLLFGCAQLVIHGALRGAENAALDSSLYDITERYPKDEWRQRFYELTSRDPKTQGWLHTSINAVIFIGAVGIVLSFIPAKRDHSTSRNTESNESGVE